MFLHEGLGCIEMWRDFPQKLCDVLQCDGVVYDRTAYGQSSPWPADPGVRYMEIEADEVLPRLLAALAIEDCVLVGHSDGGTIALNYAAHDPAPLRAVVTLGRARHQRTGLPRGHRSRARGLRHHRPAPEAGALPRRQCRPAPSICGPTPGWRRASSRWTPTAACPKIEVPVQAIQGEDDDYGSELQLGIIAGKVGGYCETRLVPDCGHSPHLQQPAYVLSEIARFVAPMALVG